MYQSVIVTGASSGIGEAIAVRLAQKGFRVFAGARRVANLKTLEGRGAGGVGGGGITAVELDVTNEGSIDRALSRVEAAGGAPYALVNCAGVSVTGPIEELPLGEWRRQFETNLFGAVAMVRAVLPAMREAGRGRIVNVSSVQGRVAVPFMGCYAASKHALEGASDALRLEAAPFGVKVSLVRPGFIRTHFGDQEQAGLDHYIREGGPYASLMKRFKAWHAKGHPNGAAPADVADAVAHALLAPRPHARYTVPKANMATLAMRNLGPAALNDRLLAAATGLGWRRKTS
ncbi:MAG: SDR family oxidoreductase [Parvularculaceae bacterium]